MKIHPCIEIIFDGGGFGKPEGLDYLLEVLRGHG
jgi:hypothetical protein